MPTLANITVKDNTATDVVFVAKSAASGDGSFAVWQTAGISPLLSADLRVKSQFNGKRDARRVEISGALPHVVTPVGGVADVAAIMPFSFSVAIPQNVPAADATKYAHTIMNVLASTLVKEMVSTGYSAT